MALNHIFLISLKYFMTIRLHEWIDVCLLTKESMYIQYDNIENGVNICTSIKYFNDSDTIQ